MNVWVDLVNSPQVLVLRPIIEELEHRGHRVVITTRDFAQTVQLADRAGLRHTPFGRHGGASRSRAIRVNLARVLDLVRHLKGEPIDLAVSHNSYTQAIAARLLRIPFVTMMDYEHHRANHLAFRLAHQVLVPAAFPDAALHTFGATSKAVRYPGLKEEIYLRTFTPDPDFLAQSSIPTDRPIVVARPPGHWADYYHGRGDLFQAFLDRVLAHPDAFVVFLPRVAEQAKGLSDISSTHILVPTRALDGPNLLYHADLVVSAGGTMNREAAVLGTPAYSVFEGELGGVDRELISQGRLSVIRSPADLASISIEKNHRLVPTLDRRVNLVDFITNVILEAAA